MVGCELDSRSIGRIVDHHSNPEQATKSPARLDKGRQMQNGFGYRPNNAMVNSPIRNNYQSQSGGSGASSSSSTDRAGSYVIDQRRHAGDSLCGSEPYTDSGIEKPDDNHLEEETRFLRDDECDLKIVAAHEQQFGTFGRPGLAPSGQIRSATMDPRGSYRQPMPQASSGGATISHHHPRPARSEESLSAAPIFQPMGPYVKSKRASQSSRGRSERSSFCPDWRCILLCNTVIIALLVGAFLVSYYYVWPVYVMPLVQQTLPIDGAWTEWTTWSECSVTCGKGGFRTQYRYCANPPAEDGGKECEGESYYNMTCAAVLDCPDCSRKCERGTLSADCTRCTCEDHVITGVVRDESNNPIVGASIYKYGHYDMVATTDRVGRYRVSKICANSEDNILFVTKKGFNPADLWPKVSTNDQKRAAADVSLRKLMEPQIVSQPLGKTRFVGQSARLCCSATDNNSSTLLVRWYKDGQLIPEGKSYNQTDTDLKLSSLTTNDSGNYVCEASNRAGLDVSPKAELVVKEKSWSSCESTPLPNMYPLPGGCKSTEVDLGQCNKDPTAAARCLHIDQFQEIATSKCLEPKSEYCCGPIETQNFELTCKPYPTAAEFRIPLTKTLKCGCVKCSSLS